MLAYTIQHALVLNEIERSGVYNSPPEQFVWPEFVTPYSWMVNQAQKKNPNWKNLRPVWFWLKRPDLRSHRFYYSNVPQPPEPRVLIEFEVREEDCLLSDIDLWHAVLNNHELVRNEKEAEFFVKNPPNKDEIEKTWERCLILGPDPFKDIDQSYWGNLGLTQGITECIKKEQIKSVKYFNVKYKKS